MYRLLVVSFFISFIISCKETPEQIAMIDYKPAYHFSPDSNWMNDPNGLVFHNGEYHLFYQYNPFGNKWGHMSWAHAVSKDLLHWKGLPIALYEEKNTKDSDTTMIFSGSAVIDSNNTSGLGINGKGPMVAIYTSHVHNNLLPVAQHQSIAYSNDNGVTWTRYAGNPVLDIKSIEFRDPKVFWYTPQQKWVMVVSKPDEHETWFYQSKNLKEWSFMSKWGKSGDTARVWECPDLIELPVVGTNETKWILFSSAGHPQKPYVGMQYFVGDFDGTKFSPDHEFKEPVYLDFGKDFYAAVSYNNAPNNRKIIVGWLNNWEYANDIPTGDKWRGAYAVPRELSIVKDEKGYRLIQKPVSEFDAARKEVFSLSNKNVDSTFDLTYKGDSYELELTIDPGKAKNAGVRVLKSEGESTIIKYDVGLNQLSLDRTHSGNVSFNPKFPSIEKATVILKNGMLHLRILVDKSVVEIFANGGETTITDLVFPTKQMGLIQLFSEGGNATFKEVKVYTIQ